MSFARQMPNSEARAILLTVRRGERFSAPILQLAQVPQALLCRIFPRCHIRLGPRTYP